MKKVCTKCHLMKELDDFSPDKRNRDGRSSHCRECRNSYSLLWQQNNHELHKANARKWHRNNANTQKIYNKNWYIANKDSKKKDHDRKWKRNHKEKIKLQNKARKKRTRISTPRWAKRGPIQKEIQNIYYNCPAEHQVDHIVPLRGENVSGLHVPWNLQYLSKEENLKKGNKF